MYAKVRKMPEDRMVILQNNNSIIKANKTIPKGASSFLFILKVYHLVPILQGLVNYVSNFFCHNNYDVLELV